MWTNKKRSLASCSECRAKLSAQADACPECGYPVTGGAFARGNHEEAQSTEMEYKFVQWLGAVVLGAGVIAAIAESPIAASVAITVGGATYLSGLMGAWWNSGD